MHMYICVYVYIYIHREREIYRERERERESRGLVGEVRDALAQDLGELRRAHLGNII